MILFEIIFLGSCQCVSPIQQDYQSNFLFQSKIFKFQSVELLCSDKSSDMNG